MFQQVLDAHALPKFHNLLQHHKNSVQKEAAWTISNITAGNTNQIQAVINENLIPQIINIIKQVTSNLNDYLILSFP